MKSTADELMRRGFERFADLDRKKNTRSIISRGRYLEQIDLHQLPVRTARTVIDEDGKFWFIPGLDRVGDPNTKVRP